MARMPIRPPTPRIPSKEEIAASHITSEIGWLEVTANVDVSCVRVLRDERMTLLGALRRGSPSDLRDALTEVRRVVQMWREYLPESSRLATL